MSALDRSQCPAVESIPGKVSGAWVFKDTRMPVATVFENLEAGLTVEEVMEEFAVTREQINAVLDFAAKSLRTPLPPRAHGSARRCSFCLTTAHCEVSGGGSSATRSWKRLRGDGIG